MDHPQTGTLNTYFSRYASPLPMLSDAPDPDTAIIITIPSYNEPQLVQTLESLRNCTPASCHCEVIVLENHPASETPDHTVEISPLLNLPHLTFRHIYVTFPDRKAGVGLARKTAMDEAARRLTAANRAGGLIAGLDADCTVAPNYLTALEAFLSTPIRGGASIYYEHQPSPDPGTTRAITDYELHLRYFVHAQRFAGAQFAYQTLGSSMVVRNHTYQSVGGMNTRKAGEDFYFLQKVMPHGFSEIRNTVVYPSPRISHRVPFGTGKAMADILNGSPRLTYAPESFQILKEFYDQKSVLFSRDELKVHPLLNQFLTTIGGTDEFKRIRRHARSPETFSRHFHTWFDGFRLMKCLHYFRENGLPDIPVARAAAWLLGEYNSQMSGSNKELLDEFRKLDAD